MKTIKKTTYAVLLICVSLMVGCGSNDDAAGDNNQQGADHTYDITINPGGDNERHVEGTIADLSSDNGNNSNFQSIQIPKMERMLFYISLIAILLLEASFYSIIMAMRQIYLMILIMHLL